MKNKSATILFLIALWSFPAESIAQNYLGYGKQYILEAINSKRKDLQGPVVINDTTGNYISYLTKDAGRAVVYHFKEMTVSLMDGSQVEAEICIKYVSINKCPGYAECPKMDEVVRSLNSHFVPGTDLQWIDRTKRNPQEWVVVRDENYFEVHVTELNK